MSPYFDGVNDVERMPLMRVDWVAKLLDGEGEFTAEASKQLAAPVYQPYMPTSGAVAIDVVTWKAPPWKPSPRITTRLATSLPR